MAYPLTDPSTQPPVYPTIGGGVSTNRQSWNRIELSQLGQDLFNFYYFDMNTSTCP